MKIKIKIDPYLLAFLMAELGSRWRFTNADVDLIVCFEFYQGNKWKFAEKIEKSLQTKKDVSFTTNLGTIAALHKYFNQYFSSNKIEQRKVLYILDKCLNDNAFKLQINQIKIAEE